MKKYIFWCLILYASQAANLYAQNLSFHKLYCTTEPEFVIKNFLPMPTGSIYVVGYDTVNMATIGGSAVIRKLDKDFNLIWQKKYGGSAGENFDFIQYLGDNRLLVVGLTNSQDGDVLNNYPTGLNQWVCIMDTNGNIQRQMIYGGNSTVKSNSIKVAPNGDFYFCGNANGNLYDFVDNGPFDFQDDGYIACADSQLNKKWLKFFEVYNGECEVWDVDFLPNGNLLLVCNSNVKDGAFAVDTPNDRGGTIIMEMDTLGSVKWQKRYGAADPVILDGHLEKIYKDNSKAEYYLTGATSAKTGDCWDSYPYLALGDHNYHWVMKVDSLGNKIWSHIYGGFSIDGYDGVDGISQTFYNNVIHFADKIHGSDTYAFGPAMGKSDTWLIYVDSTGNLYKHNRIGYADVAWYPDVVKKNIITNEMYYLYRDAKTPSIVPSPNICDTTLNRENYIIGKYNFWANSVEESRFENMPLSIYPNPARNELNIEQLSKGTLIEIYTADGKKLHSLKAAKNKETVSVSGWPRGTYLVNASYNGKKFSKKIVLW